MKTTQLLIALTLTLLIAGCTQQVSSAQPGPQPMMPSGAMTPADRQQMMEQMHGNDTDIKEFWVEAFQFGYAPAEIHVKPGDHVRIHLRTRDVGHSLAIGAIGINIPAYPGKDGVADFIAPNPGSYSWRCRIPCGRGHDSMRGTLVVE
jgi:heme/copper-type cytochrome/quinol oxidase subunit 2